jgi:hypothetical protein
MSRRRDDDPKENPDSVGAEIGADGIEALPRRVQRYGKAKAGALDVAKYIRTQPGEQSLADKVTSCGDYLVFRHYFTVDKVRLHGASLCKKHLLCPLCAIRRGVKMVNAYKPRLELVQAQNPALKAWFVTLTVKDGPDLAERFKHLHKAQRELWKRKQRGRGSVFQGVTGAVWSYEVKRGSGSGVWHPHLHMIALAECAPVAFELSREWKEITGDSKIVDVRPLDENGFQEVFKYAVKFSDQPVEDTWHAFQTLAGKRLVGSAGAFRGVEVPDSLLDDPDGFEGLPWAVYFYRYLAGAGYSL